MFKKITTLTIISVLLFAGCKKDNTPNKLEPDSFSGRINATVENDNECRSIVSTVMAVSEASISNGNLYGVVHAEANYRNGGFSINLPSSVLNQYLMDIDDFFEGELRISGKPKYSEPDARIMYVEFLTFDSSEYLTGCFLYSNPEQTTVAIFVYVDMDVTVTGGSNVSVSLIRGWNRLYWSADKVTTKAPKDMEWIFSDDLDM